MKPLELLATASLVFTAVKLSFSVIQWTLEKDADKILRRNLDALYDQLDRLSLRQIAKLLLLRTVSKFRSMLLTSERPRLWIALTFLLLNVLAYLIAQAIFCSLRDECGRTLGHDEVLRDYGALRLLLWLCLTWLGSTILQVFCLLLVHRMLVAAASSFSMTRLAVQILFASSLLVLSFFAQYAIQQLSTYIAFGLGPFWERIFDNVIGIKPYFIATVVLSAVAGIPLLAFLLTLSTSLLLRLIPNSIRLGLTWLVWKVTTDSTPVLERLGYVAGGIAGASSAIAGYVKA